MDIQIKKACISPIQYETKAKKDESWPDDVIGVISGYASTYEKDLVGDEIMPGAFEETLKNYKNGKKRIKVLFEHKKDKPIGYIEPKDLYEDEKGLFVKKMYLLKIPDAEIAHVLAKNKIFTGMSIGFGAKRGDYENLQDGGRRIKKLDLGEISLTDSPANQESLVKEVKNSSTYHDLPLASLDHKWDSEEAIERIREWSDSVDEPTDKYKQAFMYFDGESKNNFGAYKLPYADIIGGELKAVPHAISAIEGALSGARGGLDIPESDKEKIKEHADKYMSKIKKEKEGEKSDEEDKEKEDEKFQSEDAAESVEGKKAEKVCNCDMKADLMDLSQVKSISRKEFEKRLRTKGFSRKSAVYIASKVLSQSESGEKIAKKSLPSESAEAVSEELNLNEIIKLLKQN